MYLIQYAEYCFINAHKIEVIYKDKNTNLLCFDTERSKYVVDREFRYSFLNHLQALNESVINVEQVLT